VLEFLYEVVDKVVVKVFTTEVGVTGSSLDLEDALLNSQEGHIEGSSTQIKNQYIPLAQDFLVQSICNGGGSRLIDDTQNVETGNCASILCGLMLRVIEIGRNSDNSIRDCATKIKVSKSDVLWLGLCQHDTEN
jgi:hypothetical protein